MNKIKKLIEELKIECDTNKIKYELTANFKKDNESINYHYTNIKNG